jgi:hypothetical protein
MAYREASGDDGLCDGGVGKEADGEAAEIRASREGELGPSKIFCARTKHAVAMTLGVYSTHIGVRYLFDWFEIKFCPLGKMEPNERVMSKAPGVFLDDGIDRMCIEEIN